MTVPGLLLLPESLDDYVGPENPVRFIEAFVEGLDLPAAGFARVEPEETGRPGYRPADLLKLYIYGYLNRNRSSRRLEAETDRNIEVIWLLRHLKPDFKAIADFRRDNRKAFRPVFRQFVLLCKQLDLFGRERQPAHGRAPPGRRVPRCERVHIAPGAHTGRRCRCRISTLWKVRGGIRMQAHECPVALVARRAASAGAGVAAPPSSRRTIRLSQRRPKNCLAISAGSPLPISSVDWAFANNPASVPRVAARPAGRRRSGAVGRGQRASFRRRQFRGFHCGNAVADTNSTGLCTDKSRAMKSQTTRARHRREELAMSVEYLLVTFPEDRDVLADGDRVGVTNHTILISANEYVISLNGAGYAPTSQDVVVAGTSIMRPMVVAFTPAAAGSVAADRDAGVGSLPDVARLSQSTTRARGGKRAASQSG
jgi:transposase